MKDQFLTTRQPRSRSDTKSMATLSAQHNDNSSRSCAVTFSLRGACLYQPLHIVTIFRIVDYTVNFFFDLATSLPAPVIQSAIATLPTQTPTNTLPLYHKMPRQPPIPTKAITTLNPNDPFILSDNPTTGITLRTDIGDSPTPKTLTALISSQLISLSLNEAGRIYGVGKLFWIPSREERNLQHDAGLCGNGPDLVYIPWVWSDVDNHVYDCATPYERLRLSNAWSILSRKTLVLAIFSDYKVGVNGKSVLGILVSLPGVPLYMPLNIRIKHQRYEGNRLVLTHLTTDPTILPNNSTNTPQSQQTPFTLGTTSHLLLWDTHPSLIPRQALNTLNSTTPPPSIPAATRHQHRFLSCDALMAKLHEAWKAKATDGAYDRVSMEEVYADSLVPGERRDATLEMVTWKSRRLVAALERKAGAEVEAGGNATS
ncbi:hypothetical protein ES702_05936 [subsurface metagenome]